MGKTIDEYPSLSLDNTIQYCESYPEKTKVSFNDCFLHPRNNVCEIFNDRVWPLISTGKPRARQQFVSCTVLLLAGILLPTVVQEVSHICHWTFYLTFCSVDS